MKPISIGLLGGLGLASLLSPRFTSAQTDDATIQDRLAKHAEVFKRYAGRPGRQRLEDMKPNPQGVIYHDRIEVADYMRDLQPLTAAQELARFVGRFDAVISGTTARQYSAIDATHTFLYSDWIVNVAKVYKYAAAVQVGSQITVTRMGGDLTLNGQRIIDRTPIFPELTPNHRYVFILKALPDTSSFLALSGGTFDVTGATPVLVVDPRNHTAMKAFSTLPTADFLSEVERSVIK